MALVIVGEMHGGLNDRLENGAQIWRQSGFNVKAFEDFNQLIWGRYVCNVAFSGPCAVFGMTVEELIDDPYGWHVATTCVGEAYEAGLARNIAFGIDIVAMKVGTSAPYNEVISDIVRSRELKFLPYRFAQPDCSLLLC